MKELQIYDNGGETLDRYTILLPEENGEHSMIAMSKDGYAINCYAGETPIAKRYDHLGKKVSLDDLTPQTRSAVINRLLEYDGETVTLWGVNFCGIEHGRYFIPFNAQPSERKYVKLNEAWDKVTLEYHREPTKAEISFGEGALHYIDVPLWRAIKSYGKVLPRISIDGVRYRR